MIKGSQFTRLSPFEEMNMINRRALLSFLALLPALQLQIAVAQQVSVAQQNPVTAIDIALEPDATMVQHAMAANACLLKSFPKGFALDETHHAHVTMLQQFVRTDDLDKVYAAANAVLAKEKPRTWTLKAFKYYYIPSPPLGLAGIVVEPTDDLHRLQDELIKAVEPYTVKTGTPAAFFSDAGGRDIQEDLIEYVANFVTIAAGKKFTARDYRCLPSRAAALKKMALRGKKWVNGGTTVEVSQVYQGLFEVCGGLKTCHVSGHDSTA
jgi:hypothetical protein